MGHNATFWDNPDQGDDSVVMRHSQDKTSYQYPDSEQIAKMRSSRVGGFVLVPAANKDGASSGFDAHSPGVVHVDPDAPDGGAIVDMSEISSRAMDVAMSQSNYPHQVFYKLGTPAPRYKLGNASPPQAAVTPPQQTQAGLLPPIHGYNAQQFVSPQEDRGMVPQPPGTPPMLQTPQQIAQPVSQPMPAPAAMPFQPQYQQPVYGHMTPPPMDSNMQAMLLQLTQTVQGLAAQVQQIQQQKQNETPSANRAAQHLSTLPPTRPNNNKRRVDDDNQDEMSQPSLVRREQKQRFKDYQQAQNDNEPGPTDALITGFETLKMPFVTGPLPHKAKRQVFFEFEGIGKQSARYHDVVESEHCVALIYDTRYEDGTQYLPPDLGDKEIQLHVPHLKKTFTVSSMGFTYPNGVMDHLVLVKHNSEGLALNDN